MSTSSEEEIQFKIPMYERSLVINTIGNMEGALTVLMIIEGNLTDAQRGFLAELKQKIGAAADILINLERVEKKA